MAHFVRTQVDAVWLNGGSGEYVTLESDWQSLVDKVFKAMNGDLGGTWAPSGQIIVGGSGWVVTGPVVVGYGGSVTTTNGARYRIVAGAYPKLGDDHVGQTREIVTPCIGAQSTPKYHWISQTVPQFGIRSFCCAVVHMTTSGWSTTAEYPLFVLPLRVHDGGTLSNVRLTWRVPTVRSAAPLQPPRIRIVRTDKSGTSVSLMSVAGGADADGFTTLPVEDAATYSNGGDAKTYDYACDQNNVVDKSQYMYFAQVFDEAGLLPGYDPGAVKPDGMLVREDKGDVVRVHTANIYHHGVPGGWTAEDRVLIAQPDAPEQNGIWIVKTAADWVRSDVLNQENQFTPGFFVRNTEDNSIWECTSPTNTAPFELNEDGVTLGGQPIYFRRRTPKGNVYHSFTCTFENISDMRPQ